MKVLVIQSCVTLCNPVNWSLLLSMEFSRQEYWSELPFPSPGDLPNPGIKPVFLVLQTDSLPGKLMPAHDYVQKQEEKHTFFFSLGWNAFLNRFLCTAHLPELGSPSISKCISGKGKRYHTAAAAAAKSLQSCLTLCNPIDGSPPGSAIPGILQARTLFSEWVLTERSNPHLGSDITFRNKRKAYPS